MLWYGPLDHLSSVSGLPLSAFSPFFQDILISLSFFAFLCGGFTFSVPLSTICIGIFARTQYIHLVRCFQCMWSMFFNKSFYLGFSVAILLASLSFISFCIHIFLPFLALVFWPLFLLIAFQFQCHFFCHIWAYHLSLFWLYQYLHHLVSFVFVF